MPKAARVSLLLVVALLGAWFWWSGSGADHAPPPVVPISVTTSPVVAAEPTAASSQAPSERLVVEAGTGDPAEDAAVVPVRVLIAATSQPLAGAEVFWWDSSFDVSQLTDAERALHKVEPELLLRRRGRVLRADGDGRAELRLGTPATVIARQGELYAVAAWRGPSSLATEGPFAGELVLALVPDRVLTVRTVAPDGQPLAGITVELQWTVRDARGGLDRNRRKLGPTGACGLTRLAHAQELFGGRHPVVAAQVRAWLTGGTGEAVEFDPKALPTAPVDVVVPPFGSLLVSLLTSDGAPWRTPQRGGPVVILGWDSWEAGMLQPGHDSSYCDGNGEARFPHVLVGCRLELLVTAGWAVFRAIEAPQRHGDHVHVPLRLPDDGSFLAGRIVAEDGSAVVAVRLVLEVVGGTGRVTLELLCDDTGRFLVPVPDWIGRRPRITFHAEDSPAAGRREAAVTLRADLLPGRNELGTVVLTPPPLLVAGQVVIVGGAAAPRPVVGLELDRASPGEPPSWQKVDDPRVKLDADLRFEVRAHARDERFRLRVVGAVVPVPPLEFAPGTDDLRIEMVAGG
jgi:hypothetical protein